MITILYMWGIVTMASRGTYSTDPFVRNDWKHMGEYATMQHCEDAAKALAVQDKIFRCINTGRPK